MTRQEFRKLYFNIEVRANEYGINQVTVPYYSMPVQIGIILEWYNHELYQLASSNVPDDVASEIIKLHSFVNVYIDEHFPTHNPKQEWEHVTSLNPKWDFNKTYQALCYACSEGFEFLVSDGNLYVRERSCNEE